MSLAHCLVHVCTKFHAFWITETVLVIVLAIGWAALETCTNAPWVYVRL
jgi:hypothetical protein